MKWVLLSYLLIIPLSFSVNFDSRDIPMLVYQIGSVLVFAIGMFFPQRELKFSKLNMAIGALLIAFVLAWFRIMNGWPVAENFLFGILVYLTVIKTLKKEDCVFIFKGIGYLAALCIAILALQFVGYDFRGAHLPGSLAIPPESIFFQRSTMGMFFAQSIPMILSFSPVAFLLLIPIYYSLSSAAYLGAMGGILFFLWFRKRIWFWVALSLSITGIVFSFAYKPIRSETMRGLEIRLPMWKIVLQEIVREPLGHGLNSFVNPKDGGLVYFNYFGEGKQVTAVAVRNGNTIKGRTEFDDIYIKKIADKNVNANFADHPHNEYLWFGYEIGLHAWVILGFIFYFLWDRFRRSKRDMLTCASMAVLVCLTIECIFQFPVHVARVGCILPFILGVFYLSTEEN